MSWEPSLVLTMLLTAFLGSSVSVLVIWSAVWSRRCPAERQNCSTSSGVVAGPMGGVYFSLRDDWVLDELHGDALPVGAVEGYRIWRSKLPS